MQNTLKLFFVGIGLLSGSFVSVFFLPLNIVIPLSVIGICLIFISFLWGMYD